MKTRLWFVVCAGVLALAFAVSAAEVLPLKASFSASAQDEQDGQPKIVRLRLTEAALINLARGRAHDAAVPANEILALLLDCSTGVGQLVVFNTSTRTVLAVAGEVDTAGAVEDVTKGEAIMFVSILNVGGSNHQLTAGFLVLVTKFSKAGVGCPAKVQASVTGVIRAVITDEMGPEHVTVLVPKGKMTIGPSLGRPAE
jgi:hypothetical protein